MQKLVRERFRANILLPIKYIVDTVVHALHLHAEAVQTFRNLGNIDGETTAQTLIAKVGTSTESETN